MCGTGAMLWWLFGGNCMALMLVRKTCGCQLILRCVIFGWSRRCWWAGLMQMICDAVNVHCILPHAFQLPSGKHGFCTNLVHTKPTNLPALKGRRLNSWSLIATKLVYWKFKRIKTMNTLFATPSSRLDISKQWIPRSRNHDEFILVSMTTEEEVHTKTIATMMNFDNPSTITSCGSCWRVQTEKKLWA